MIRANDEPVATATWLSHFVLCEQVARAGFDTLFGGLGGDELNAGEYEYFFFHFADLARTGRTAELETEIRHWAQHHDHPIYRKNAAIAMSTIERCTDQSTPGVSKPDVQRLQRYYRAVRPEFYDLARFEPVMEAPFASYLKTRSYQDLTRETAPCCLRAEDRQTQAFGLENQVPFFDHRLVEFMFRVPGALKIRSGVTKILLRDAMQGVLPEETRTRVKKTGWNAPAHVWFSGAGKSQLEDLVHSRSFIERGIYDAAEVQRLVREHDEIVRSGAARENHMMFLWQLVNLEIWLRSLQS
jgi:asparagine synthase (glutamine-hydrolysing)